MDHNAPDQPSYGYGPQQAAPPPDHAAGQHHHQQSAVPGQSQNPYSGNTPAPYQSQPQYGPAAHQAAFQAAYQAALHGVGAGAQSAGQPHSSQQVQAAPTQYPQYQHYQPQQYPPFPLAQQQQQSQAQIPPEPHRQPSPFLPPTQPQIPSPYATQGVQYGSPYFPPPPTSTAPAPAPAYQPVASGGHNPPPSVNQPPPLPPRIPQKPQQSQPAKYSRLGASLAGFVQSKAQAYLDKYAVPQQAGHAPPAPSPGSLSQPQQSGGISPSWQTTQPHQFGRPEPSVSGTSRPSSVVMASHGPTEPPPAPFSTTTIPGPPLGQPAVAQAALAQGGSSSALAPGSHAPFAPSQPAVVQPTHPEAQPTPSPSVSILPPAPPPPPPPENPTLSHQQTTPQQPVNLPSNPGTGATPEVQAYDLPQNQQAPPQQPPPTSATMPAQSLADVLPAPSLAAPPPAPQPETLNPAVPPAQPQVPSQIHQTQTASTPTMTAASTPTSSSTSASASAIGSVLKLASQVQKMALTAKDTLLSEAQPHGGMPLQQPVQQTAPAAQQQPALQPLQQPSPAGQQQRVQQRVQVPAQVPSPAPQQQQQGPPASSLTTFAKLAFSKAGQLGQDIAQAVPKELPKIDGPASMAYNDPGGDYYDYPEVSLTPMRASGSPEPVQRFCHGGNWDMGLDITYYRHPSAPEFLACSRCHDRYIRGSSLESQFEKVVKSGTRCLFNLPRITKRLWPTAQQTGDMAPVIEFMKARTLRPHCKGSAGAVLADNVQWYRPVSGDIPGFVACETCYEDLILATAFADRFEKSRTQQGASAKWSCDVNVTASGFIAKALLKVSAAERFDIEARWQEFVRAAARRIEMPVCKGEALRLRVSSHRQTWYRLRDGSAHNFCEVCYMDHLALTHMAGEFTIEDYKSSKTKYVDIRCDLEQLSAHILIWICNGQRLGPDVLRTAIDKAVAVGKKRCFTREGIKEGRFYNFRDEISNYGVCEACHALIIEPNGLAAFMGPKPRQMPASSGALYCIFNSNAIHFYKIYQHFVHSLALGVFSYYEDYARKWCDISACSGRAAIGSRVWFGWEDCPICAECHETFVAGTALAASLPWQNKYLDEPEGCSLYSKLMRDKYTAACAAGDPAGLLAAARERRLVYAEVMPRLEALEAKVRTARENGDVHMSIYATHLSLSSMDAVIGVGAPTYYYSGVGYRTSDQMAADNAWRIAQEFYAQANDVAVHREIATLRAKWKVVE